MAAKREVIESGVQVQTRLCVVDQTLQIVAVARIQRDLQVIIFRQADSELLRVEAHRVQASVEGVHLRVDRVDLRADRDDARTHERRHAAGNRELRPVVSFWRRTRSS